MDKPLIRASFVGKIMSEPKLKADKEAGSLSESAKTELNKLAKQIVYGFRPQLNTKPVLKGVQCEQDSIDLFNRVFFTFYEKNQARINTDLCTGECDILGEDIVIDIKSSYSLETFPATPAEAENDAYYWQGVMYMMLYDRPRYAVAYCIVDTPDDLCSYEQPELHLVSHIPEHMRVTMWHFDRDLEAEKKLLDKCAKAQEYIIQQVERIKAAHQY